MPAERPELRGKIPIVELKGLRVVEPEMVDSYGNHLNHASALKIFEDERMRLLEVHGMPEQEMERIFGILAFVHEIHAKYNQQAFLGDHLEVLSSVYPRLASLVFHQRLEKQGKNVLDALISLAVVNTRGRPTRPPKNFLDRLNKT